MMEVLYGERIGPDILFSQPCRQIVTESLLYDDEIEKDYIDSKGRPSDGRNTENIILIGTRQAREIVFYTRNPELADAIVTLLTTEEFESLGIDVDSIPDSQFIIEEQGDIGTTFDNNSDISW
jgi:hypothetical protein